MSMMHHEQEPASENRYDPQTQQKVIALASRLQQEHQETLTARQIEEIGAEVGLEPDFVRQALVTLTQHQTQTGKQAKTGRPSHTIRQTGSKAEFWSILAAFVIPMIWGILAFEMMAATRNQDDQPGWTTFFCGLAPIPIAWLLGFIAGKKRIGFVAAAMLALELSIAYFTTHYYVGADDPLLPIGIMIGGAGLLGVLGAWMRQRYFPFASSKEAAKQNVSRPDLLNLLFSLQSQLEAQKQHRTFLSVDVVGSKEMKRDASELAVEHSFGQYRQWIEEIVKSCGGQMQIAAGDGVMCIFPTDADAVRAARRLQEELPQFNTTRNRLPMTFRIRCGISAG